LKILQQQPTTPADDSRSIGYAYKASLIGAAQQFDLTGDGLSFRFAGRSGLWRYADIAAVRLSYRPVSMQSRRFRADLHHVDGGRLVILSTSWQTAALDGAAGRRLPRLHHRTASAHGEGWQQGHADRRSRAQDLRRGHCAVGIRRGRHGRASHPRHRDGPIRLLGFAALFGWQVGGFITRNRPVSYEFERIPEALLP
jgi:hypothetical protein